MSPAKTDTDLADYLYGLSCKVRTPTRGRIPAAAFLRRLGRLAILHRVSCTANVLGDFVAPVS